MATITVLSADAMAPHGLFELPRRPRMAKAFSLDADGQLVKAPYDHAVRFSNHGVECNDIHDLARFLTDLSQRTDGILIRGVPVYGYGMQNRLRNGDEYKSDPRGCPWVMLDIDDVPLPQGLDPLSSAAHEFVISKLPEPFRHASYFFQCSASAGILKPDGTALKQGISVHLFFWLGGHLRPDAELAADLELHCLRTGFYERYVNRGGVPAIRYGIDLAVVRNPVQPHYVAHPVIGKGVQCLLRPEQRQGLVRKERNTVILPKPEPDLMAKAVALRREAEQTWKRECGWVPQTSYTKAMDGSYRQQTHLEASKGVHTGRVFTEARFYPRDRQDAIILGFEDENSPGSWYVNKNAPTVGRRFGDGATVPLRELSVGAYEYVRTQLRWFADIPVSDLALGTDGFLPPLADFVSPSGGVELTLAPTGSGKTRRIIEFVQHNPSVIFFYAAPTIPLCEQMVTDLQAAGVPVRFYQDVSGRDSLLPGVIVTTNKSLPKFVGMARRQGARFVLLLDEIHSGLDEFQRNQNSARHFEDAIMASSRTLMFTGTLTPVQFSMLGQVVASAKRGAGHDDPLKVFRFAPVKRNPLILLQTNRFETDVLQLLGECSRKHQAGEPIPRIVIAADRSKLDFYRLALRKEGLEAHANVISRQESTPEQITAASADTARPILVCSPIFSVGLNFINPPQVYWVVYQHLQVDQNHIVQTLNRANRVPGQPPADVRLYTHGPSEDDIPLPPRVRLRGQIAQHFGEETSIDGVMDEHFLLDRATYNQLRNVERRTTRAMRHLLDTDDFQNFQAIDEPPPQPDDEAAQKARKNEVWALRKTARIGYDQGVQNHLDAFRMQPWLLSLTYLDQIYQKRQELRFGGTETTLLDLEQKTQAGICELCGLFERTEAAKVHCVRILRLMTFLPPFLSSQYSAEGRFKEWQGAAIEKVQAMIPLVQKLARLRRRELDGVQWGIWMSSTAGRQAVLALADNEADFLALSAMLDDLRAATRRKRTNASKQQRQAIDADLFTAARAYLQTLGTDFEREDPWKRNSPRIPALPIVPDWDFEAMVINLQRLSQSLKHRTGQVDLTSQRYEGNHAVTHKLCNACAHQAPDGECRMGRPTEHHLDPLAGVSDSCPDHARMNKSLAEAVEAMNLQTIRGEVSVIRMNRPVPFELAHRLMWEGTRWALSDAEYKLLPRPPEPTENANSVGSHS
ncbi:MAG: DEAD/DEAH box helicase [Betaproteobacteria bacterium]|nr:DEAD/DEAH box helicase [Betaproteobacteria bacterium]MDE2122608.1 DEAD/DEAH box helicase [Betaproteobacteria bacterium]MDE2186556.1 DEAD/DEAH box helicase [Betaproteobacteria bacterium]MDE2324068.1 DEAD/DEAH box helicase [Betaproteobacteria bacterium]